MENTRFNAEVTIRVNVEVNAESEAVASELIEMYLCCISDDNRVVVGSTDGINLEEIEEEF